MLLTLSWMPGLGLILFLLLFVLGSEMTLSGLFGSSRTIKIVMRPFLLVLYLNLHLPPSLPLSRHNILLDHIMPTDTFNDFPEGMHLDLDDKWLLSGHYLFAPVWFGFKIWWCDNFFFLYRG